MKVIPGTVAFEAVVWLQTIAPASLTTAELAHCLARSARRLPKHLGPALRAGLVARHVAGGRVLWSQGAAVLAVPPKPIVSVQPGPMAFPSVFHYAQSFQEATQ